MKSSTAWPALTISMILRGRLSRPTSSSMEWAPNDGFAALGGVVQELIDLGDRAVVGHHGVAVVVHVQDEVLAHHGQTDQCDVRGWFHVVRVSLRGKAMYTAEASGCKFSRGLNHKCAPLILCRLERVFALIPRGLSSFLIVRVSIRIWGPMPSSHKAGRPDTPLISSRLEKWILLVKEELRRFLFPNISRLKVRDTGETERGLSGVRLYFLSGTITHYIMAVKSIVTMELERDIITPWRD